MWTNTTEAVLQGLLMIALAPALAGWVSWLKSIGQGRKRHWAFIFQPYRDLRKLLQVPAVHPLTTSWVFSLTPCVMFVVYAMLAFTIPILSEPLLPLDVIVVIYLLALVRFMLSLAGWDAGASFGGLGSSREMFLHFSTEIGLFLVFIALVLRWNTVDLTTIFNDHSQVPWRIISGSSSAFQDIGLIFLPFALVVILLFEAERIPVDNPETHLELTMAQKAITLEFAGSDLALIELAEMIKLMFLLALLSALFLPFHILLQPNLGLALMSFLAETMMLGALLALWELRHPKTRLRRVSRLAWGSVLFSLISIAFVAITRI